MSYPDLFQAEDYDGIRSLLGVTDLDVADETIDQLPFGPQAEAWVEAQVDTWEADKADAAKGLLLRMAAGYAAAAYLAETFVKGGVIGLVRIAGQPPRDWRELAQALWSRASQTVAGLVEGTAGDTLYDLVGLKIGGPSRAYYKPIVGTEWWKYPPVIGYSGPMNPADVPMNDTRFAPIEEP